MTDSETLFLCRPCAEAMKSFKTVASVQIGPHKRVKQLCEQCGRSRYGYLCDVTFKDPEPLNAPCRGGPQRLPLSGELSAQPTEG